MLYFIVPGHDSMAFKLSLTANKFLRKCQCNLFAIAVFHLIISAQRVILKMFAPIVTAHSE